MKYKLSDSRCSSSEGPFLFHAWLELPSPIAFRVEREFTVNYLPNKPTKLKMEIRADTYKIVTGNMWHVSQELEGWAARVHSGAKDLPPPLSKWIHEYITKDKLSDYVTNLESDKRVRYVHIEELPSVVYISAIIPDDIVPDQEFDPSNLMPSASFFNKEVLPYLQSIIDAYRIASLPFMRYTILPVSESFLDTAYIHITNNKGECVSRLQYGFDVKNSSSIKPSLFNFAKRYKFQDRFDEFFPRLSELEAEDRMASSYYLYHMRRWTESVAVASSVVDGLLMQLVFKLASTDIEAQAIWKAYRYKELFNTVFPAFGKPKLSKTDPLLWQAFVKAKEYRGAKVHGDYPKSFDAVQEKTTKQHLEAFNNIARWIKRQMGLSWALDMYENSNLLQPFP